MEAGLAAADRVAPRAAALGRFEAALHGLMGDAAREARLALAVSGGADSLALLFLAAATPSRPVIALTVDHRLRAESTEEARQVGSICSALGVEHHVLPWEGERGAGSVQAAAREARYRLMGGWCADKGVRWLATAHHADDQAETLLMRLARGVGVSGLSGIRPSRRIASGQVTLIRPLLSFRRSELVALCRSHGVAPVEDLSNRDPRFDRTHARALLANAEWLDAGRIAEVAAHAADAEAALDWMAGLAWRSRVQARRSMLVIDAGGLPREVARRLLLRGLRELGGSVSVRGGDAAALLDRLAAGGAGSVGGVHVARGDAPPGPPRMLLVLRREERGRRS